MTAPTRVVLAVLLALLVGGTAGCGGDDSSTPDTPASSAGGESGAAGDDEVLGICALVTGEELAGIVGGSLTASPVPGGGCSFAQDSDLKLPSLGVNEQLDGDLAGARSGLQGSYDDNTVTEPDLGDGAVVVVGRTSSDSVQGSGLVLVGDTLVQVDLNQGSGYPAAKVTKLLTDVLALLASKG